MTVGSGIYLHPAESDPLRINRTIRSLMEGRSNAVGTVTLSTGTTTTVTSNTCGYNTLIFLTPQTANAAAAIGTTFILSTGVTGGSFIVSHAASANTDQTFGYLTIG